MNLHAVCHACTEQKGALCKDTAIVYLELLKQSSHTEHRRLTLLCNNQLGQTEEDLLADLVRSCFLLAVSSFDSTLRAASYTGGFLAYCGHVKRIYLPKKIRKKYYSSFNASCQKIYNILSSTLNKTTFIRFETMTLLSKFLGVDMPTLNNSFASATDLDIHEISQYLSLIADRRNLIIHYNDVLFHDRLIVNTDTFINAIDIMHNLKIATIDTLLSILRP